MFRQMMSAAVALALCSAAWMATADSTTLLRCRYAEPLNQVGGRYVIASIDLVRKLITLDDHASGGTNSKRYRIAGVSDTSIRGARVDIEVDELINIDRLSGRITLSTDATKDADRLWNEEKQQIGGFDLSDGKRLWLTANMDCRPAEPVL